MNQCTLTRLGFVLAMLSSPTIASALIIDNFDDGPIAIQANAANPFVQAVSDGPGIIGGEREATVTYYAAGSSALDNVDLRVDFLNQNNFSHSQDAGVAGTSIFVYDGNDGDASSIDYNGLGGIDLMQGNATAFILDVIFADQSVANVLEMRIYTSATEFSELFYSFPGPINSPTPIEFLFSNFTLGDGAAGMADFTNVNAIVLAIDGRFEPALDIRLDMFATNEQPVVPEPATLGLLGLGLSCMGLLRRRKGLRTPLQQE